MELTAATTKANLRVAAAFVGIILVIAGCQGSSDDARTASDDWLGALTSGDTEAAWIGIDPETRKLRYEGDQSLFASEVSAADWSAASWWIPQDPWWNDVVWVVEVRVPGGSHSMPPFLFDRELVQRWLVDGNDRGIIVLVGPDWIGKGLVCLPCDDG